MKIAFLVMQRKPQNHRVAVTTGGFRWAVNFTDSGRLSVRIARMYDTERKQGKERTARARDVGLLVADPMNDVQVVIGETNNGASIVERDQNGDETQRTPVRKEEFGE